MKGRPTLRGFLTAQAGVAAIELAIVFPVLVVLMLFGLQAVTYVRAVRKVELLASSMSEMLSQAAPPAGSTTALVNTLDLHFAYDAGMVIFPYLMQDATRQNIAWWQDITIDFAGIQFAPTGASCPGTDQSSCYKANVAWTSTGTVGNNARPCGTAQLPTDSAAPSNTALPRAIFGPGSLIVVDVVFTFQPSFASRLMSPQRIARSVYLQPRYASVINYDTTNSDGIAIRCPGY